jgi:hypothetical protein
MGTLLRFPLVSDHSSVSLYQVTLTKLLGVSHDLIISEVVFVLVGFNHALRVGDFLDATKTYLCIGEEVKLAVFLNPFVLLKIDSVTLSFSFKIMIFAEFKVAF